MPLQDIWVCNAGQSQQVKRPVADTTVRELQRIVDTNLMGENACCVWCHEG